MQFGGHASSKCEVHKMEMYFGIILAEQIGAESQEAHRVPVFISMSKNAPSTRCCEEWLVESVADALLKMDWFFRCALHIT